MSDGLDYYQEMRFANAFKRLPCSVGSKRLKAVEKVIERLEPAVAERLVDLVRNRPITWFIPDSGCDGLVEKLPEGAVIYISPLLELRSDRAITGAVAHEIAHVTRGLSHGQSLPSILTKFFDFGRKFLAPLQEMGTSFVESSVFRRLRR